MPQPPSPSWWNRNWKWVVPVGCAVPMLLCGGFIALIFTVVFGAIKSATPYTESLATVKEDPRVQAALGAPVEAAFLVTGNINVSGPSGHADISYSVSGPKGSATVYVVADKSSGQWTFTTLVVQIDNTGERIDLLAKGR